MFVPPGGFGMNTGLQDAHNIAWKIAMVVRGKAPNSLLATYESGMMVNMLYSILKSLHTWCISQNRSHSIYAYVKYLRILIAILTTTYRFASFIYTVAF